MADADQLFDRLLRERRLVSYIDAHEILFGVRPNPWRSWVHYPPVVTAAQQTKLRHFEGLSIQLDALVVSQSEGEPGSGFFKGRPYAQEDWRRVFGGWPLLQPTA